MDDIAAFQFLRPWAWLLLPVLGLLAYWLLKSQSQQHHLSAMFAPNLLAFLSSKHNTQATSGSAWLVYLGVFSLVIALSGPSYLTSHEQLSRRHHGVVFVVDLSLSMLATDLKPNRLSQARFALLDIVDGLTGQDAGLIVYSDSAFIISPITPDRELVRSQLAVIHPDVMPSMGTDASAALNMAAAMLNNGAYSHGHIVWVTDDVHIQQLDDTDTLLGSHTLSALVVGTSTGATIRLSNQSLLKDNHGHAVFHRVENQDIVAIAQRINGTVVHLNAAHTTLSELSAALQMDHGNTHALNNQAADYYQDIGAYFLLPLATIILWLLTKPVDTWRFSRGGMWILVVLLSSPAQQEAYSETLPLWMHSREQQATIAFAEKRYEEAYGLFEDPKWQAQALIEMQEFDRAIVLLAQQTDAQSQYNLAYCLIKVRDYDGAIVAYDNALSINPAFIQAQENKTALLDYLAQRNKPANNEGSKQNGNKNNRSGMTSNTHTQTQLSEQEPQQNAAEQRNHQSANRRTSATPSVPSSTQETLNQHQQQAAAPRQDSQPQSQPDNPLQRQQPNPISQPIALNEAQQARYIEALMERIEADPTLLLKRRLQLMHQQRHGDTKSNDKVKW